MNKKIITRILTVTGIAASAYYVGVQTERQRLQQNLNLKTTSDCDACLLSQKHHFWGNVICTPFSNWSIY